MATLFTVYSFPKAFSTAFARYYIEAQTNTITPFPGRNFTVGEKYSKSRDIVAQT